VGQVELALPDGSRIIATQQQLTRPLPYSAIGVADASQLITFPSGTQAVVVQSDGGNWIQVVMVRPSGLMTQVTGEGIPPRGVKPPLSMPELVSLMQRLDQELTE
jgi:hypothetical protein